MTTKYKTLLKFGRAEIVIDKSLFIGYSSPITSEEEAIKFIEEIKARHKDATHNVSAYVVGLNNEIQRYNDDGEPTGTAGIPVLEVIKKEDLRNCVVVVARYFGGIKLGGGGLIRAYTKGAKVAIDAGKIITKELHGFLAIEIDYPLMGKVQNEILQKGYIIKEIKYDQLVHFFVYIPLAKVEIFKAEVIDWTNNNCKIKELKKEFLTT